MTKLSPIEKVETCLSFIDQRLEKTAEQTITIAEMMIADIKEMVMNQPNPNDKVALLQYVHNMQQVQMTWLSQLNEIILEQANRDLNGQVIQTLKHFAHNLNQSQLHYCDFELPSIVAREQHELTEYLNQSEIELLMNEAQQIDKIHH